MASFVYNAEQKLLKRIQKGEAKFSTPIFEFLESFDSLNNEADKKQLFEFAFTKNRIINFIYQDCEDTFDKNTFLSLNKSKIDMVKAVISKLSEINYQEIIFKRLFYSSTKYNFAAWFVEAVFDHEKFHREIIKIIRSHIKRNKLHKLKHICRAFPQYNYFLMLS